MADLANITSALMLRDALVCISSFVPNEDVSDAMTFASIDVLESALIIPAASFSDIRMKLAAIMADAGCGLVEVEDLAFIARDMDALLEAVQ